MKKGKKGYSRNTQSVSAPKAREGTGKEKADEATRIREGTSKEKADESTTAFGVKEITSVQNSGSESTDVNAQSTQANDASPSKSMKLEKTSHAVRCDFGCCKNISDYTLNFLSLGLRSNMFFCESCLNELYNEIGRLVVPKSPLNKFDYRRQGIKEENIN